MPQSLESSALLAAVMRRALALADRGRASAWPNPMVGAVLLDGGRIVAEGWHERPGAPHAEVACLAGLPLEATTGRTLVVTLEPCSHHGRTPPCADLLVARRLGRVVAATGDPNPLVAGRGFARLREAGVDVRIGPLADEARRLNRHFFRLAETGRPWTTLKWAQSRDGFIAAAPGRRTAISGAASRREVHRLRSEHPGILVGVGTALADDPRLDVRHWPGGRAPLRFVIDPRGELPPASALARTARSQPVHLLAGSGADSRRLVALGRLGCVVHRLDEAGELPLFRVLETVAATGVDGLLVEGGAAVHGRFLTAGLADELLRIVAPDALGGGVPAASLPTGGDRPWRLAARRPVGEDLWETWRPAPEEG